MPFDYVFKCLSTNNWNSTGLIHFQIKFFNNLEFFSSLLIIFPKQNNCFNKNLKLDFVSKQLNKVN